MEHEQSSKETMKSKSSRRRNKKNRKADNSDAMVTALDDQPGQPRIIVPRTIQTTSSVALIIPKDQLDQLIAEKNDLLRERAELLKRVEELSGQSALYLSTLQSRQVELDILREENLALKEHIKKLELNVTSLNLEVTSLKKSVKSLETDKEYSNYVIALQDINRAYRLERNATSLTAAMRKLRNQRVAAFHYILDDDDEDIRNFKVKIALEKLASMSDECKDKFSNKFGGEFLDIIATAVVPPPAVVTDDDMIAVEDWWID